MSYQLNAYFNSTSGVDTFNVTHDVKRALRDAGSQDGLLTVYIPSSTAGVVVLENDNDIKEAFKQFIVSQVEESSAARPVRKSGSGNNEYHMRAALLNRSVVIPIKDGKLLLGPWQEVIVYDFDSKVGRTEVQIHVLGEGAAKK